MQRILLIPTVLVLILIGFACRAAQAVPPEVAVYGPKSDLIFKGQVLVLHTSTTDSPDAESTGVVRVLSVIKSPPGLPDLEGKDITVRFIDISTVSAGEQAILFTNIVGIGNELSVTEVSHLRADDRYAVNVLREASVQATQAHDVEKLRDLVRRSELVVSGVVASTAQVRAEGARDSEHDPMWTEATVEVSETIRGNANRTISFVFSASTDVAWYQAPKFKQGDRGVFVLRRRDDIAQIKGRWILVDKSEFITDVDKIARIREYSK